MYGIKGIETLRRDHCCIGHEQQVMIYTTYVRVCEQGIRSRSYADAQGGDALLNRVDMKDIVL